MGRAPPAVWLPELPTRTVSGDLVPHAGPVNVHVRAGCASSHKLPFETSTPMRARFSEDDAIHRWSVSSRTLRQLMDHFGPGIELLDINTDEEAGVANFTCYTEKVPKRTNQNTEGKMLGVWSEQHCSGQC